jgi:gluconolactonase
VNSSGGDRLAELVDPSVEPELLGEGFVVTEGPVWSPFDEHLYFSDIPADCRWRWSEENGMEEVMRPNFKGDGLVLESDGHLLVCEHVTSMVTRYRTTGEREVLAYHYEGRYLNSPNDIVTRSDGGIYFTDPDYGRHNDFIGVERTPELGFKGVYRVEADGSRLTLLVDRDEFDQPNGLCFSPDERLLYVNDSPREHVKVFDVASDGSLGASRVFHEGIGTGKPREGTVDGMKCDERGNLWVTGPRGIWVIDPAGELVGVVEIPGLALNMVWGGDDFRMLYVACLNTVCRLPTLVRSAHLPYHPAPPA